MYDVVAYYNVKGIPSRTPRCKYARPKDGKGEDRKWKGEGIYMVLEERDAVEGRRADTRVEVTPEKW